MPDITVQQASALAAQHYQAGNLGQAETLCRQILSVQPNHAEALHLLGVLAHNAGHHDDAVAWIERALLHHPTNPSAHSNLGEACLALGRTTEAIEHYRRALALDSRFAIASYNLGNAFRAQGRLDEAVAAYRRALQLDSNDPKGYSNLASTLAVLGRLDDAIAAYREAIRLMPQEPSIQSSLICLLRLHPGSDEQAIVDEHQNWNRQFAEPLRPSLRPHTNHRVPHRRLRIGYVSPDFRIHAELLFLAPLFGEHDHTQFEIHCYSSVVAPDAGTEFLRARADVWHDVRHLSDAELATEIRAAQIDILVDLSMHTVGNRLPLFARKPAPVQVSWLAYPGITGLDTIDYRITDRYLDPSADLDFTSAEKPILLPDCWCCYHPFTDETPVNPVPALSAGRITFGCFNNFSKFNEETLARFSRVLHSVKNSHLVLLAPEGSAQRHLSERFAHYGIAGDRIEFAATGSRADYLRRYHRVDIALDTLPSNGMATTCETLWMGVPVISLVGETSVGRAGLGLLSTIGLPELVTRTPDEFVSTATQLATDLPRLADLRATMRSRMESSPLMDAPRFARHLEAAYREMWHRWCATPAR
ncbi:putative O-linked N-acetylglucosamine transferase (SPINDLY family) [Chthoniobacter flavus]|nr:tetratricopeptide repeat protein [Chthoniobacter flavus]TCO87099.1 putative O-linked N-acetylglucosamine transferase (SPINDLY family) [Chthoniobacter flavus]